MSEQQPPRDAGNWSQAAPTLQVAEVPHGAVKLNVDGRRTVGPLQGFGRLWQKTYRIRLEGVQTTPEAVVAHWKTNFPRLQPRQNRFFPSVAGVQPGEVVLINASLNGMPVKTAVRVLYADDTSFTLVTPEGHPESGWVTFSAFDDAGTVVCQVQSQARANDPLYELGLRMGAAGAQENIWRHVLRALAADYGVNATAHITKECLDPRVQWRYTGNLWHNAAIRSTGYALGAPIRWLRPHRRAAPHAADRPLRNRAASVALTFGILSLPLLLLAVAGLLFSPAVLNTAAANIAILVSETLLAFAILAAPLAVICGVAALRWARRHPTAMGRRIRAAWGITFGGLACSAMAAIAVNLYLGTIDLHQLHLALPLLS